MRTYSYNQNDLQDLFARVIEWLGAPDKQHDAIGQILGEVCRHFRLGLGFIYETDHTGTLHLREQFAGYITKNIQRSFMLEAHLPAGDAARLLESRFFYSGGHPRDAVPGDDRKAQPFGANTLLMVPVLNQSNHLIGLAGMMDRRRNILLDDQAVSAAKMALDLLANSLKIRIYRRSLEYTRKSLVDILDNTGVDIYVTDYRTDEILYVNQSMAAPYGGRDKMLGQKCWQALYDDKNGRCDFCPRRMLVDEAGNPTKLYSWDYRRPYDGSWFRVLSAAFRWVDGRLAHVISSVDITENKLNEATIAQMANYDSLTGLPNRRKLSNDCEEAMRTAAQTGAKGHLLFFDLDKFKEINDSLGHQAGDDLLQMIGKELQDNPLTRNHCYRYGGDEFVLLYRGVQRQHLMRVVSFLVTRFGQPWPLPSGEAPECNTSIGVAEYPAEAGSVDALVKKADALMYTAKRNGGAMACFGNGLTVTRQTATE